MGAMKRLGSKLQMGMRLKDPESSPVTEETSKATAHCNINKNTEFRSPPVSRDVVQPPELAQDTTSFEQGGQHRLNIMDGRRHDAWQLEGRGSSVPTAVSQAVDLDTDNDPEMQENPQARPYRPRTRPPSLISVDAIAAQLEEAKRSPGLHGTAFFTNEASPTDDSFGVHSQQHQARTDSPQGGGGRAITPAGAVLQDYYANGPASRVYTTNSRLPVNKDVTFVPKSEAQQKPQKAHPLSTMPSSSSFYTPRTTSGTASGYNPMAAFFGTAPPPSVHASNSSASLKPAQSFPSSETSQSSGEMTAPKQAAHHEVATANVSHPPAAAVTAPHKRSSRSSAREQTSMSPSQHDPERAASPSQKHLPSAPPAAPTYTSQPAFKPTQTPLKSATKSQAHQEAPLSPVLKEPHPKTALRQPQALPDAAPPTESTSAALAHPTKPKGRQYTTSGSAKPPASELQLHSQAPPSAHDQDQSAAKRLMTGPPSKGEEEAKRASKAEVKSPARWSHGETRAAASNAVEKPSVAQTSIRSQDVSTAHRSDASAPAQVSSRALKQVVQVPTAARPGHGSNNQNQRPLSSTTSGEKGSMLEARYASGSSETSHRSNSSLSPVESEGGEGQRSPSSSWTSEELHKEAARARAAAKGKGVDRAHQKGHPDYVAPLLRHFQPLLALLLPHLELQDVRMLKSVNRATRRTFSTPGTTQAVLQRFLAPFGYDCAFPNDVALNFEDLVGFMYSSDLDRNDYAALAKEHLDQSLPRNAVHMMQSSTRAYSRLAVRLRSQLSYTDAPYTLPLARQIYKPGRALLARVWVPAEANKTKDAWMTTDELVECERELQRAGIFHLMQKGDCIENVSFEAFGNDGKLIFDGKYLRDLGFDFDPIGHAPKWINALTITPAHWHGVISASTGDPILYFDLTPFLMQVANSMRLQTDKVNRSTPQKDFWVTKYVYRSTIKLKAGHILGAAAGGAGNGPAGIDCVHPDYEGVLVVETDGTTEHAAALKRLCTPPPAKKKYRYHDAAGPKPPSTLHPFRVLRGRSRPGALCITPLYGST